MLQFPDFDPVALRIGPLAVHWYGLMYLFGFGSAWVLGRWRIQHGTTRITMRDLEDIIFYGVLAVVAGGRLGYVLFYKPSYYLSHPAEIFFLWEGGMSFHGGLIGVLTMMALLAWRRGYRFLEVGDFVAPLIPLALAAGRLGNFINGELWGRPSTLPWAMVFPHSGDGLKASRCLRWSGGFRAARARLARPARFFSWDTARCDSWRNSPANPTISLDCSLRGSRWASGFPCR